MALVAFLMNLALLFVSLSNFLFVFYYVGRPSVEPGTKAVLWILVTLAVSLAIFIYVVRLLLTERVRLGVVCRALTALVVIFLHLPRQVVTFGIHPDADTLSCFACDNATAFAAMALTIQV